MAKKAPAATSPVDLVRLLVDAANADTVYRDVYLRRAHALLAEQLPAAEYRALQGMQRQIDAAVAQSRSAAALRDWPRVQELAARADDLRRSAERKAPLMTVAEQVYDAPSVAIDTLSAGMESFAKKEQEPAAVRDHAVASLAQLATVDATHATFYEIRRAFLSGLTIARRHAAAGAKRPSARAVADIERLAAEAAQRGDVAALRGYAQEILAQQAAAKESPRRESAPEAQRPEPAPTGTAESCPVDLGAPFPADLAARAHALGFAVARTEPLAQAAPLFDYVASHMRQRSIEELESEHEGAIKIEALVDENAWPAGVAEHVKVLVGQFVRNVFVNSGGARYRPTFAAESVLIEDFPEEGEPPADSSLLAALGLGRRRALARTEIESALLEHGARILEERLGLDPYEFRLVCIPQDLYSRFGRDRGWGAQAQWTHFDGYQVMKGARLRALVGGDARYGGLNDLVSIAPSDQRESVIARFAVIRRARHVGRWC